MATEVARALPEAIETVVLASIYHLLSRGRVLDRALQHAEIIQITGKNDRSRGQAETKIKSPAE